MSAPQSETALKTIAMAIIIAVHFMLIALVLYLGNAEEFVVSAWEALQFCFIIALILLLVLYVLGRLFRGDWRCRYTVALAALGLLIWVQGTVLIWDYGILDGRNIDWSIDAWRGWLDATLWVCVILSSLIFYRRVEKLFYKLAFAVVVIHIATTTYSSITNLEKLNRSSGADYNSDKALEEVYKFSTKNNIVHLMLDGFQSDVFEDLMNHETVGDEYRSQFSGFTFYNETLGVFPYTRFSVPAFLGGKIYKNDTPKNDFIKSVLKGNTILNVAYENDYDVDIASEAYFSALYANGNHTNSHIISKDSVTDFKSQNAATILDLTLFRVAPHFIKRYIYNNQNWLIAPLFSSDDYLQHRYFSHTAFLNKLTENMSVARDAPVYKYIHVMNAHNPMVVSPNCGYAGQTLNTTRETLTVQSKCTLDTIIEYFKKMKDLGLYDNALIIIHADHGGWVVPHKWKQKIYWKNGPEISPLAASLASPLLAIKPPGSSSDSLSISPTLASLADIPDTISDIMNWDARFGGESVVSLDPGKLRDRKFYFYAWQRDAWETDYTGPIQEFLITGSHFETPWRAGKIVLPTPTNY